MEHKHQSGVAHHVNRMWTPTAEYHDVVSEELSQHIAKTSRKRCFFEASSGRKNYTFLCYGSIDVAENDILLAGPYVMQCREFPYLLSALVLRPLPRSSKQNE